MFKGTVVQSQHFFSSSEFIAKSFVFLIGFSVSYVLFHLFFDTNTESYATVFFTYIVFYLSLHSNPATFHLLFFYHQVLGDVTAQPGYYQ